jgi:hypothetical protein
MHHVAFVFSMQVRMYIYIYKHTFMQVYVYYECSHSILSISRGLQVWVYEDDKRIHEE